MRDRVPVRTLLFDLDDVLVDATQASRRAIAETVYHFTGFSVGEDHLLRYRLQSGYSDPWRLVHALVQETGMAVSAHRVIDEYQRRYRGDGWQGLIALETPRVHENTLATLAAGRILGVVSDRYEAEVRCTISRMGWKHFFPLVIPYEQQERRTRPDPYPLQRALAMLSEVGVRVSPHHAAYVGDSGDDMLTARAAGLWAIGLIPPFGPSEVHERHLYDRGAHVVLHTLEDLPEVLESLGQAESDEAAAA